MTAGDEPVLDDARDRRTITSATSRSLFVEAGAGTGKTRSLVERIVHLVEQDRVDVNQIAAITFTEAAARELRIRVRDALVARAEATDSHRLVHAASQVESAAFTTLHGFALRLLVDYPIEAGLPPGFGVVDEMTSIVEFEEAWKLFMGRVGDEMALYELQERADGLEIRLPRFVAIARQLDDNWDRIDPNDAAPIDVSPALSAIDITELTDGLAALASRADLSITKDDKLYHGLVGLGHQVERLGRLEPVEQLRTLESLKFPPRNSGRKTDWESEPGVQSIRDEVKTLCEQRDRVVADYKSEVAGAFSQIVTGFVLQRVARRRRKGELSFHDLLVMARQLLRSDEGVRQRLYQRYTNLLLDEFQDTDPIQIELAVLLAHRGPVGDRPWEELAGEIEQGRLVVVGDPKQSIYRFRRADIVTFDATERCLAADSVALTTNFRSVPSIVEWVNQLFGTAMGEGTPGKQPPYRPLKAHRHQGDEARLGVQIIGGPVEGLAGEIRTLEAADVAKAVATVMAEQWPVEDREGGGWRPPRLGDIAILIPSRTSLPSLESAFSALSIPLRPETSSLVYATQEVREVLAGIRAIVDPANAIDVVAALRSSLFSVPDNDLIAWHEATGSWDYRLDPADRDEGPKSVREAFQTLRDWHGQRWWITPAAMVDSVVRDRRLREVALAEPRARDRWRRYRFLAEQAREFTESQGGDLHDFVRWAEIQSSDLARITEPIPAEPDDDAVRLLTIHGSKGLEFPIVVLAGAATAENRRSPGPRVVFSDETGVEIQLGKGTETAGFDAQATIEDAMDSFERVRLHYVASTRARDYLIASAYHKQGKTPSMGRRTWEAVEANPELCQRLEGSSRRPDGSPLVQLRLAVGSYSQNLAVWEREQLTARREADAARTVSPSALSELDAGTRPLSIDSVDNATTTLSLRDSASGTELGLAVHWVLETIDLERQDTVAELSYSAAQAYANNGIGIPDLAASVERRVKAALASETIELAATNPTWSELYVALPVGPGVLEGFIDLCIETEDGLIVVDYKTDHLDPSDRQGSMREKLDRYRLQLGAYAKALAAIADKPVIECRLLFLTDDGAYCEILSDIAGAIDEVDRVIEKLTGSAQQA